VRDEIERRVLRLLRELGGMAPPAT